MDKFVDARTGLFKHDEIHTHDDETAGYVKGSQEYDSEFASRSPQFNRKKYPFLGDKEFQTKKPRV